MHCAKQSAGHARCGSQCDLTESTGRRLAIAAYKASRRAFCTCATFLNPDTRARDEAYNQPHVVATWRTPLMRHVVHWSSHALALTLIASD